MRRARALRSIRSSSYVFRVGLVPLALALARQTPVARAEREGACILQKAVFQWKRFRTEKPCDLAVFPCVQYLVMYVAFLSELYEFPLRRARPRPDCVTRFRKLARSHGVVNWCARHARPARRSPRSVGHAA